MNFNVILSKNLRSEGVGFLVQHLPTMSEALGSILSTGQKRHC
jgi:hypothetical protein